MMNKDPQVRYRKVKEANYWLEYLASCTTFALAVFFGIWVDRWTQTGNWHNTYFYLMVGSLVVDIILYRICYSLGWWMMEHLTERGKHQQT